MEIRKLPIPKLISCVQVGISNNLPPSQLFDQVLEFEDICSLNLYLCIELTNRNSYCITHFLLIKSECGFFHAQVAQL